MTGLGRTERAAASREALVASARAQFGARGYAAVSTTHIVSAAGLTLGALYHHFPGKAAVFLAVHERVEAEIAACVSAGLAASGSTGRDPLARLCAAIDACVDAYTAPEARQILLVDGPGVLGPRHERAHATVDVVAAALQVAMEMGALRRQPPAALAHLVVAAVEEAAGYIARCHGEEARRDMTVGLHSLVRSLSLLPAHSVPAPRG